MDVQQLLLARDLVLIAFDGPVAELPATDSADSLRTMVADTRMPRKVARTRDPLVVLDYAATVGPATAVAVHRQLRRIERGAVVTARPAPGVVEAMKAMVATGTKIALVSAMVIDAVRSFVVMHGLDEYVWRVAGRGGADCSVLPPAPDLLLEVTRGRAAEDCGFVGATGVDLAAGRAARISTYRYRRPAEHAGEPDVEPDVEPPGPSRLRPMAPPSLPWFEALCAAS